MKYRLIVTDRALDQIDEAADWWSRHRSSAEAERWYDGIHAVLRTLDSNPRRFSLANENDLVPYELRYVPYGLGRRTTHRALFTIDDDAGEVRVILVHHVARGDVDPADLDD